MTDLHTHILPGIDDGAAKFEEAIALLRAELSDGVDTVALTPHFRTNSEDIDVFLARRKVAFDKLTDIVSCKSLEVPEMILGAEVAFSAGLVDMDLQPLCYSGTKTLLIELPADHFPPYTRTIFYELMIKGYKPIIAHVERYPYFDRAPDLLESLTDTGALLQVTAGSLLDGGKIARRALKMIRTGVVSIIATDTHGMTRRPPRLSEALKFVQKKTGLDIADGGNLTY